MRTAPIAMILALVVGAAYQTRVASAAEGGSGVYLLGLRGAGAGVTPPPGVFFSNQFYRYSGSIEGSIPFEGGRILGRGDVSALVAVPTILWVTPAEIAGGRVGLSLTAPYGRVDVDGRIGPIALSDRTTAFGDPSVTAFLGWRHDNLHWQLGATGFLPVGGYKKGALANVAKNRLAVDVFGTMSWIDPALGLDVSNVVGVTFNAENRATNYRTGTEFHWEWSVTKKFENGLSVGPAGYYYRQLTDDTGSGAVLGGFRGETLAVAGVLGFDFVAGGIPVSTKLRYFHEVKTKNRLKGNAVFLSLSMPLWVPR